MADVLTTLLSGRLGTMLRTVAWTELVILGFKLLFPGSAAYVGDVVSQMPWWQHAWQYRRLYVVLTELAAVAGAGFMWLSLAAVLAGRLSPDALSNMTPVSRGVRERGEAFLCVTARETSGWYWALFLGGLAFRWPSFDVLSHGWRLPLLFPVLLTPLFVAFTAITALAPTMWARAETQLRTVATRVQEARVKGLPMARVVGRMLDAPELAHLREGSSANMQHTAGPSAGEAVSATTESAPQSQVHGTPLASDEPD